MVNELNPGFMTDFDMSETRQRRCLRQHRAYIALLRDNADVLLPIKDFFPSS
jgi:hypothetical protein